MQQIWITLSIKSGTMQAIIIDQNVLLWQWESPHSRKITASLECCCWSFLFFVVVTGGFVCGFCFWLVGLGLFVVGWLAQSLYCGCLFVLCPSDASNKGHSQVKILDLRNQQLDSGWQIQPYSPYVLQKLLLIIRVTEN